MASLYGMSIVETMTTPDNPPIVFGSWKQYWEKKAMEELDRAVWEALGFGDKWFPPDVPTCGPGWHAEIKTIVNIFPEKKGWNLFSSYPPVSRDWNLAMWAAEKIGLFQSNPEYPEHGLAMFSDFWCVMKWCGGAEFDGGDLATDEIGTVAICKAILKKVNPE